MKTPTPPPHVGIWGCMSPCYEGVVRVRCLVGMASTTPWHIFFLLFLQPFLLCWRVDDGMATPHIIKWQPITCYLLFSHLSFNCIKLIVIRVPFNAGNSVISDATVNAMTTPSRLKLINSFILNVTEDPAYDSIPVYMVEIYLNDVIRTQKNSLVTYWIQLKDFKKLIGFRIDKGQTIKISVGQIIKCNVANFKPKFY